MRQPSLAELQNLGEAYKLAHESHYARTGFTRYIFLCVFLLNSAYATSLPKKLDLAIEKRISDTAKANGLGECESIDQLYEQLPSEIDEGLKLWKPTVGQSQESSLRFWRRIDFLDKWIKELQDAKSL